MWSVNCGAGSCLCHFNLLSLLVDREMAPGLQAENKH